MRNISDDEYLNRVDYEIECDIEDVLFDRFNALAEQYGFDKADFDLFHSYFWDGYAGKFRELAIKLFEWLGMDVTCEEREMLRQEGWLK